MPYISFESGELKDEVRQELIEKLTEVSAEITGIPKDLFLVVVKEHPADNMALGGKTVRELRAALAAQ